MQKIRMTADGHKVLLTDSPEEASLSQKNGPVIGICSPGSGKSWSGISFLAEDWDDVDEAYVELAYCRYYHLPRTLLCVDDQLSTDTANKIVVDTADRVDGVDSRKTNVHHIFWKIREAARKDAAGFAALYEDEQVKQFLDYPLRKQAESLSDWEEWIESLHRYVYPSEEPSMWVLADEHDEFIGRIGLEYRDGSYSSDSAKCDAIFDKDMNQAQNREPDLPIGYYVGYALLPKWRKKGLAAQAASQLLEYCFDYWQLDEVYLLCSCENIASIKTAIACGFSHIRTISNDVLNDPSEDAFNAFRDASNNVVCDAFSDASSILQDINEHPLNLSAGVSTSEFFLFTRKAL